ncbi:MAG TPA: hypothetical protein VKZ63_19510 [Kofleriaceae bacterium]|nr:hypothetical protein [Kofleriaceae bacterium]
MILVVVTAAAADRVSEALRAGLGLGLRGDPVEVLLVGPAAELAARGAGGDPRVARALATLELLGRPARAVSRDEALAAAGRARAVEVWSDPAPATRRLVLRRGGEAIELDPRALDSRLVAEQILEADGVFLL